MGEAIKKLQVSGNILLSLIIASTCTACTHLQTNPTGEVPSIDAGQPATAGAQRGVSYALPMLQFDLKITRSLNACPDDGPPEFTVKVEAQERYVAGERFEVDYQAMSSPFKTTGFDISYHESGTLRTINARAQDQTGTVLTNVARIGLAVAGAASGNLAVTGAALGTINTASAQQTFALMESANGGRATFDLRCTTAARAKLASLETASNEVKARTATVAALTERVTSLSSLATLRVMSARDRADLSATVRRLLAIERLLRAANARVTALQRELSATQQLSWPDQAGGLSAHTLSLTPDAASLEKLSGLLEGRVSGGRFRGIVPAGALSGIQLVCENGQRKAADACLRDRLIALTTLNVALAPTVTQTPLPRYGNGNPLDNSIIPRGNRRWARGIFIREPVEARLIVCQAPATVAGTGCGDGNSPAFRGGSLIAPQLGRLRLLPFRSRAFENNRLQLSMRANGFIEQFSYGEESSAVAATGALADIAERTQTALEAMETERRTDIQYARDTRTYERNEAIASRTEELAQLAHELNMLKAQRDLLAAQIAVPDQQVVAQAGAEKALIDAEVQLLQSRIARLRAANDLTALSPP